MSPELIGTVLTGAGVLFGIWGMVDGVHRELGARIDGVEARLTKQIAVVNTRIDNILLRRAERES